MGSHLRKTTARFPHVGRGKNACCAREPTVIPSRRVDDWRNACRGARSRKGREQRSGERILHDFVLGMPLYADDEARRGQAYRLDLSVGGDCLDPEARRRDDRYPANAVN